ncbi:dihydrofolate reductase family protein [Nocardia sp. NPDC051832]|uniref:dihydrofolate reductase family protein n=1 Tax=Nocardia sp. NPDC051832 TaxID=3155673 RepID=UPI00342A4EEE
MASKLPSAMDVNLRSRECDTFTTLDTDWPVNWALEPRPVCRSRGLYISELLRRITMGQIIITENISLDGVIQDPTGEEGFDRGGWFDRISDKDREHWAQIECAEAVAAEALLLGRRSFEWFAPRWSPRRGEWADRLNTMPKLVVSSTLENPAWQNSTVLNGDVLTEVTKLKQNTSGDIVVYASATLARTLIEHDLADELRLMIFPVVLGAGERLFGPTTDQKPMHRIGTRIVGDSLVLLTYRLRLGDIT